MESGRGGQSISLLLSPSAAAGPLPPGQQPQMDAVDADHLHAGVNARARVSGRGRVEVVMTMVRMTGMCGTNAECGTAFIQLQGCRRSAESA